MVMSCLCGLSREMVLEVAEKHGVPLVGGKCQNPLADGTEGICGRALGAHPPSQGKFNSALFHAVQLFHCASHSFRTFHSREILLNTHNFDFLLFNNLTAHPFHYFRMTTSSPSLHFSFP